MTLFYSHHDRLEDASGGSLLRAFAKLAISRTSAALTCIHQAIVAAKIRRMRRDLMFHDIYGDEWPLELDLRESYDPAREAAKFPRQPLILGDKWDFWARCYIPKAG